MIYIYEGSYANDIWLDALSDVMRNSEQDGRDQPTREILFAHFELTNPRNRYVTLREIDPAFAIAEVFWIMSGSAEVEPIAWWNNRMRNYSDDGITFHGAYGSRLRSMPFTYPYDSPYREGHTDTYIDQLHSAYLALRDNPTRRDVVIQIWDSRRDLPDTADPNAKDIPCNVIAHPLIREGKLVWMQHMRSNDIVWGWPYNIIQWTTIQEIMAGWLGVEVGSYHHISDSLHIYQRHYDHAEDIITDRIPLRKENTDDLRVNLLRWEEIFMIMHSLAFHDIPRLTEVVELLDMLGSDWFKNALPEGYRNMARVLIAEAIRKLGDEDAAYEVAKDVTNELLRTSYLTWLEHKTDG